MKLGYRVLDSSSSDDSYPASELNQYSPSTRGWQSARFCEYPQTIVLGLDEASGIRQVQLLSHESKISSRIELFVGDDSGFERLGFMSLDANERSQFQARELKSVFVECHGKFLKLVMHRCHVNRENLFNQVGLVALNVIGKESTAQNYFDEMMSLLGREREHATSAEDYDSAAALEGRETRLRLYRAQVAQLETAKGRAVDVEDYDRAKSLKIQINTLVENAKCLVEQRGDILTIPELSEELNVVNARFVENSPDEEEMEPDAEQLSVSPVTSRTVREPSPELEGVPNNAELPIPEPTVNGHEGIVAIIGLYRTRCLFSKNWLLRDASLVKLRLMLIDKQVRAEDMCAIARIGIDDKIPQVYFSGVSLLLECKAPRHLLEPGVLALIAKLVENQQRVRDRAFSALELLAPTIGCSYMASLILKTLDKKDLYRNKWRPIAARLRLMTSLAKFDRLSNVESIFHFISNNDCVSHTSAHVRSLTRELVATLSKQLPNDDALFPLIGKLRPKQRDEYSVALGRPLPVMAPSSSELKKRTKEHQESLRIQSEEKCHSPSASLLIDKDVSEQRSEYFRDLIMKQLEEHAFSIEEAYDILKEHFDTINENDGMRENVLREWCAEIGTMDIEASFFNKTQRDILLKQVATWLFQ